MKMHEAPRCTAKSKRTSLPCKSPAVRGWQVCRMYGAGGGAPTGASNGAWIHGGRSAKVRHIRRNLTELLKVAKDGCEVIEKST